MIGSKLPISILTLNANGLHAPLKRHTEANWIKQETHLTCNNTHRLKVKSWRKFCHSNGKQKRPRITILLSDKTNYKPITGKKQRRALLNDKGCNSTRRLTYPKYICSKYWSTHIHKTSTSRPTKRLSHTIIEGDSNTPLTALDRSSRQKTSKEIMDLNSILDQLDLIDIYNILYPSTTEYTYFSSAHGTCSMINHILSHKANLNTFKKIKII